MAQGITAGPFEAIGSALAAGFRRTARDIRLMVPLCIVLICGSFAAATILSMRLDRAHALDEAARFEQQRAVTIAQVAAASLDRLAWAGMQFAADPASPVTEPLVRDIAVFNADGEALSSLKGQASILPPLPRAAYRNERTAIPGGIALRQNGKVIAVRFDLAGLVPVGVMTRAALADSGGALVVRGADWSKSEYRSAPVPGWPFRAQAAIDTQGALAKWTGSLPLYLFVILGPAVVGGWLAALFVGSFERHARARARVRELKSTRPIEPKLLVRLAHAERGASEALRSKSEFIAHMSHELRTPLNAVIGFSEIIAEGFFGPAGHPKYAEYARDITVAGRNLHDKIGDILEFANIEAGRYPLSLERVDMAALAQTCLDEQQGRAFSRRIDLGTGFSEPGEVRADPRALRRILACLLTNALTYTAPGGTIRLDVRFEDGAGVLTVTDSGVGFSDTEKTLAGKAFQRFDRAGTVTGAGLGLAIAMELARRMGGAMRLSSLPGQGSVMDVRLPGL